MEWFPSSKDHLPLTWWKQTPVYLAAVIAVGAVASMVLTALLAAVNEGILAYLYFTVGNVVEHWRIWTVLTYLLVNPPSLWFLLTAYLLYSFGEALERHLGRRSFVKLLLLLVLVSPALLGVLGFFGVRNWPAMGVSGLGFGVFIAFATLYPSAQISIIILTLEAWLMATIIVVVDALQCLAEHQWGQLFLLVGQVAVAMGYIRYEQGRLHLPSFDKLKLLRRPPPPALSSLPRPRRALPSKKQAPVIEAEGLDNVDAILDKISHQGMASLTDEEKRTLEKASEQLSKRSGSGR